MPLRVDHVEGQGQYLAASSYFCTSIREIVRNSTATLGCTNYFIIGDGGQHMPVRLWGDPAARSHGVVHTPIAQRVMSTVEAVHGCDGSPEKIKEAIARIPHHIDNGGHRTFFIELLDEEQGPFTDHERTRLVVGIVDDMLEFVSTDHLQFVHLDDGMYGMAVSGKGSYLIKVEEE